MRPPSRFARRHGRRGYRLGVSLSIDQAADRLRRGGLVAFPTETVYGLGARAFDADAVARVFALKGRPADNPLIVHVAEETMARTVVAHWPDIASRIAQRFWPGPVTLVLRRAAHVPPVVTAGGDTVAVRAPDHPIALDLIRALGEPIVGPSANRSGEVSPTCAAHVRAAFTQDELPVLDGGPCRVGIESTVVALHRSPPTILRPGVIGPEALRDALGERVASESAHPARADGSPGRIGPHYRPRARVVLVEGDDTKPAPELPGGGLTIVLAVTPPPWASAGSTIPMPGSAGAYAARLYAALRDADASAPETIVVVIPPVVGDATPSERALWNAIRERLARAAADPS